MPAATTQYFQGMSSKENEILQQAAQPTKVSTWIPLCCNEDGRAAVQHARDGTAFAQDTNRKTQKGAGAGGAARPLPTSYHDYSTAESGVEQVHVGFVLVYGQIPTFTQAESLLKPFCRIVAQPEKVEQSYLDYSVPLHSQFFQKA
jgi:hypothetical protein